MKANRLRGLAAIGLAGLLLVGVTAVFAATSVISGSGTMGHYEPFGGPATMTARSLFIGANEVLGWHQHPGVAYTIVKSGTLTVEDGCGGTVVYPAGSAFIEPPGRVHRGMAGDVPVETVQTFLVPAGSGFSISVAKACGPPLSVEECKDAGWRAFDYPRAFANQGECIASLSRSDG